MSVWLCLMLHTCQHVQLKIHCFQLPADFFTSWVWTSWWWWDLDRWRNLRLVLRQVCKARGHKLLVHLCHGVLATSKFPLLQQQLDWLFSNTSSIFLLQYFYCIKFVYQMYFLQLLSWHETLIWPQHWLNNFKTGFKMSGNYDFWWSFQCKWPC